MNASPERPPRKTKFALIASCVLAALITIAVLSLGTYLGNHPRPLSSPRNECVVQLIQIAKAKELWMLDQHKGTNDICTWSDLAGPNSYIPYIPQCPRGGAYKIGKIYDPPICSIADHNEYYRTSVASAKGSTTNATP